MTHSCKLENFSSQVFENGCDIDCCLGSNAHLVLGIVLQKTLDTSTWKLENISNPAFESAYSHKNICDWCHKYVEICEAGFGYVGLGFVDFRVASRMPR